MAAGFSTAFIVIFGAIFFLLFLVIILLRFAKYGTPLGSLAATMVGGRKRTEACTCLAR